MFELRPRRDMSAMLLRAQTAQRLCHALNPAELRQDYA